MNRTLVVLTLAACMAQTGAPIVVLLGGIIGAELAPSPGLATLPVALMILGTAASTIPASFIMRRFGRRKGFLFAASYAVVAGLLAAFAVQTAAFWLLCTATFLIGSHNAFVQQYRFAVAESVPAARLGRSLSVLMLAGVVAAYLGPKTATLLQDLVPSAVYAGSFLGLSVLMAGAGMVLSFYVPDSCETEVDGRGGRSLWQIAQQLDFKIAIVASVAAWSIMSLLMTATPVAMHHLGSIQHDRYGLGHSKPYYGDVFTLLSERPIIGPRRAASHDYSRCGDLDRVFGGCVCGAAPDALLVGAGAAGDWLELYVFRRNGLTDSNL